MKTARAMVCLVAGLGACLTYLVTPQFGWKEIPQIPKGWHGTWRNVSLRTEDESDWITINSHDFRFRNANGVVRQAESIEVKLRNDVILIKNKGAGGWGYKLYDRGVDLIAVTEVYGDPSSWVGEFEVLRDVGMFARQR